ncbi:MAG: phosphoribosylamine--glycine ligase [bacterium]|nr:phosphoribosylamine--glycine ligase [bacterium]
MRILLLGNGGREHAIAEAFHRSAHHPELHVLATKVNPGIRTLAKSYEIVKSLSDIDALKAAVKKVKPDFAFVGPDNPIGDGMVDVLEELGVPAVAPKKAPAQLESSKYFTRELLEKHLIPGNPRFRQFTSDAGIMEFLQELGNDYVVKADGLAFGKGVKVSGDHLHSHEQALAFARECLQAHPSVVIEEKLTGVEFSLMAFADGKHLAFMPCVQDHKRAYEGDEGPNTGGMGSYSDVNYSLPFLTQQDLDQAQGISRAVLEAVKEETGQEFKGILYGGFMACKDGVKLIEYNARFGDPEAMNVLPILETDFVELCQAIITGTLDQLEVKFAPKATVCLYVVPEGYPDDSQAGETLIIDKILLEPELWPRSRGSNSVQLFYSSVDEKDGRLVTSGSRSLGVVGVGDSIEAARRQAVEAIKQIQGKIFYRKDIGSAELIQKRIDLMGELRG